MPYYIIRNKDGKAITANYDIDNLLGAEKLRLVVRSLIESKKES